MSEECQHVWLYDHKDYMKLYNRCAKCGETRAMKDWGYHSERKEAKDHDGKTEGVRA